MDKELSETYAPMMKFHLSQLRYFQTTRFNEKTITITEVYKYICSNNIKNICAIVDYFAENTSNHPNIIPKVEFLFKRLSELLKN